MAKKLTPAQVAVEAEAAKLAAKEKMAKAAAKKKSVKSENLPDGVEGVDNSAKIAELLEQMKAEPTQGGRKKIRAKLRNLGYSLREIQRAAKAAGDEAGAEEAATEEAGE